MERSLKFSQVSTLFRVLFSLLGFIGVGGLEFSSFLICFAFNLVLGFLGFGELQFS